MYQVEKSVPARRTREISSDSMVSERVSSLYPSSQGKIVHKLDAWKFKRNTTFDRSSNGLVANCSAINLYKLSISVKESNSGNCNILMQSAYSLRAHVCEIIVSLLEKHTDSMCCYYGYFTLLPLSFIFVHIPTKIAVCFRFYYTEIICVVQ